MAGAFEVLRQLYRNFKTQKLRTFLTTFGIVWGTVAVTLLLAFGNGLHKQVVKSAAGLGDRIVIAWPARTSIPFDGLGKGRRIRATEDDIVAIKSRVKGLAGISSEYSRSFRVHHGDKTMMVDVSGVSPVFGTMRNLIPQEGGRFVDAIDMRDRRRVIFLGDQFAIDFLGEKNPVGQTFMLGDSPFLVVGTLKHKEQDSSYSGRDKDKAFIPSTTFRAITGEKYLANFIYKAHKPGLNKSLTKKVRAVLASRKHFDPKDTHALKVWDTTEMFAFMDTFMLAFQLFLGIIGSLTLVVGGIGASNIMNVVVEERTREIGIKMALGSHRGAILRQFLMETLLLTAIGGSIGILIAWGICSIFPAFGLTEYVGDPTISVGLAILTASILGVVGLLAGYFPARDAANLNPVVAMKL